MTLTASDTCKSVIADLLQYYTVEELIRGIKAVHEDHETDAADKHAYGREAKARYHVNRMAEVLRIYEIHNKHGI